MKGSLAMYTLFEKQDSLNFPIETFIFDARKSEFPVRPHWHYFAEVLFMLSGSAEVTCDERVYKVGEGELVLLPPSAVHSIFPASEDVMPVFAGIKFDPVKFPNTISYAPSVTDIFKYARERSMKLHFGTEETDTLCCKEIFDDCVNEMESYRYGRDVIMRSQIYRLIFGMIRLWISAGLDIDRCPVNSGGTYGIENITEYIDSRLEENLRVSEIAGKCHLSYSGFAAKFRSQYGMSCKEYIERMRIFKAEEYLLFTDHDLSFIAGKTGFSDCSHFIRSFRRYRGTTPKQFRQQRKQSRRAG